LGKLKEERGSTMGEPPLAMPAIFSIARFEAAVDSTEKSGV
jgi:hypothetical protein